ncbi:hypothetical protein ABIB35_000335 [Arthrobacter sp. UYP6]|uniref:hypothetical protein n=1 Tax=Arthrobacter sp. UYP6 TaxID=1756378 RepID=UPI003396B498
MSISSDTKCASFFPGHNIHLIHAKRLVGFDDWVDAQAYVDVELGVIQLVVDGRQQLMWFHDMPALALALEGSGGAAQWCARYSSLLVPGGFDSPARRSFFYLAAPEKLRPCNPVNAASDAEAAQSQPS